MLTGRVWTGGDQRALVVMINRACKARLTERVPTRCGDRLVHELAAQDAIQVIERALDCAPAATAAFARLLLDMTQRRLHADACLCWNLFQNV